MEKALVHYSGGLDSLLAACKTVEEGYKAVLIHYNNGMSYGSKNILEGVRRLQERYGEDVVSFWGYGLTIGYYKALRESFWYTKPEEALEYTPDLTLAQLNCLACRSAMYIFSILVCQKEKISTVVDGARVVQGFCLERNAMINEYQEFFKSYGINFFTPVLGLDTDIDREISLYIRGMAPVANEAKCMFGVNITFANEETMLERDREAVQFWNNNLKPVSRKLIKESQKIKLDNRGKLF